jgi:hypothetical protein
MAASAPAQPPRARVANASGVSQISILETAPAGPSSSKDFRAATGRDETERSLGRVEPRVHSSPFRVVGQQFELLNKTNLITSVKVSLEHENDSTQFIPLLKETAKRFTIKEVSADAANSGSNNFNAADAVGATSYIAFKGNTTGGVGGLFAKMFHYCNFNRDVYLSHHHQGSNVETAFSMVKAKFGDSLRSKPDSVLINEALCKILWHNLCCLIASAFELGIEAKFWGADELATETQEKTEDDTGEAVGLGAISLSDAFVKVERATT